MVKNQVHDPLLAPGAASPTAPIADALVLVSATMTHLVCAAERDTSAAWCATHVRSISCELGSVVVHWSRGGALVALGVCRTALSILTLVDPPLPLSACQDRSI